MSDAVVLWLGRRFTGCRWSIRHFHFRLLNHFVRALLPETSGKTLVAIRKIKNSCYWHEITFRQIHRGCVAYKWSWCPVNVLLVMRTDASDKGSMSILPSASVVPRSDDVYLYLKIFLPESRQLRWAYGNAAVASSRQNHSASSPSGPRRVTCWTEMNAPHFHWHKVCYVLFGVWT